MAWAGTSVYLASVEPSYVYLALSGLRDPETGLRPYGAGPVRVYATSQEAEAEVSRSQLYWSIYRVGVTAAEAAGAKLFTDPYGARWLQGLHDALLEELRGQDDDPLYGGTAYVVREG